MSESSDWDLQVAIVSRLKSDAGIKALVGDPPRIEQQADAATLHPYIHIGESDDAPANADCVRVRVVTVTLHVWSTTQSFEEIKRIEGAIDAALDDADLTLPGGRSLASIRYRGSRNLRDPDGISRHGVVTLEALVQG